MIERITECKSITDVEAVFRKSSTVLIQTTNYFKFQHESFSRILISFEYFTDILSVFLEAKAYKILVCSKDNSKKLDPELLFKHNILVITV